MGDAVFPRGGVSHLGLHSQRVLVGELGEVEEMGDAEVGDAVFPRGGSLQPPQELHWEAVIRISQLVELLVGGEELEEVEEEVGDAVFPRTAASSSTPCSLQPP